VLAAGQSVRAPDAEQARTFSGPQVGCAASHHKAAFGDIIRNRIRMMQWRPNDEQPTTPAR